MSQSIAIDELWTKKPVHNGIERTTMTLRATGIRSSAGKRDTQIANSQGSDPGDDQIEVPTKVMRGNGLCSGKTGFKLILMVGLWIISLVDYGMINIYLKHLPGNRFLNFTTSGVSEIFAHTIVGVFFVKLTPRWTFFIGFAVALCGAIPLVW